MDTIGAALTTPGVEGLWLKTHLQRKGTRLIATTYFVGRNHHDIPDFYTFRVEVNAKPILRRLLAMHKRAHGEIQGDVVGFSVSDVASKTWKFAKGRVLNKAYSAVKSVARSKITAGVAAGLAVFPPTAAAGAAALGALAAANVALDYAESGKKVVKSAEAIIRKLKNGKNFKKTLARYAKKHGRKALRSYLKNNPKARAYLKHVDKYAKKAKRFLTPKRRKALAAAMRKSKLAKKFFGKIARTARYGKGQSKTDALKMARIVRIAAKNRRELKRLVQRNKAGIPGILIDTHGNLKRGRYALDKRAKKGSGVDVLVTPKGATKTGTYKRVRISKKRLAQIKKAEARARKLKAKLRKLKRLTKGKKRIISKKQRARIKRALKKMPPKKRRRAIRKITRRVRSIRATAKRAALLAAKRGARRGASRAARSVSRRFRGSKSFSASRSFRL